MNFQPPDPIEDREAMEEAYLERMRVLNPWRTSIENILTGDNYFRTQEWHDLLTTLDGFYQDAAALDSKLQDAYASGRADEREECMRLINWAYSKIWTHTFSNQDDALMLDEIKLMQMGAA